jgi:hypothetical protein
MPWQPAAQPKVAFVFLCPSPNHLSMERRRSFGLALAGSRAPFPRGVREAPLDPWGNAVNYPSNPRFHPKVAFRMAAMTEDMEQRRRFFTDRVVVITDEGAQEVWSKNEVKDIIMHQFGIRKQEFVVYRSYPEPFIAIFSESHAWDVVFATGSATDGLIELSFHAWELNKFGDRENIHYHVRLCVEGVPHHNWSRDVVERIMCDEALIHHVEEESADRSDFRSFNCWVFCKDPSRIPQSVFLSLPIYELEYLRLGPIQFSRPREVKKT